MAAATGLNQTAISKIWRTFGLQPHRVEHWKLSKDPLFVEKVRDVVGLYLDPPERAVVLCVEVRQLNRDIRDWIQTPGHSCGRRTADEILAASKHIFSGSTTHVTSLPRR